MLHSFGREIDADCTKLISVIAPHRYVQLTEAGRQRFHEARRRGGITLDALTAAPETPSVNTIKKALRREKVFLSTLERLWNYLRHCTSKPSGREILGLLTEGDDYLFC